MNAHFCRRYRIRPHPFPFFVAWFRHISVPGGRIEPKLSDCPRCTWVSGVDRKKPNFMLIEPFRQRYLSSRQNKIGGTD